MSSNLKVNNILPSTGDTVAVSGIASVTSSVSIASSCTATTFYGSGANLTSLPSQVTINNATSDRVLTSNGGTTLNAESALTFDGNTLTVSAPSNDTPLIVDTASTNGAHLRFQKDGSNQHFVGAGGGFALGDREDLSLRAYDNLLFATGNSSTERVRIDSGGRIGVGGISPSVYSSGANNLVISAASGSNAGITIDNASGGTDSGAIFFSHGTGANAVGRIRYYHSDDHMDFYTANAERLRIDSSGHVMIGTTTEGFATYGDQFTIANSGHCGMTIRSGTSSYGTIYFSDGDDGSVDEVRGFVDYNHSTNQLQLGTNAATRLRIDSSGYVTKPSQPAFHAYGDNQWVGYTGSNNTVKLLNSNCNVGSHYKTSGSDEGKFVCPVAGNYLFYFTLYSGRTDNSQTDNNNYLSINLISSTGSLANKGGHHIAHYYNEADRDSTRTMSYIKTCAVGEKIYISVSCNGAGYQIYGGHSGFGGYLLG